MEFSQIEEGVVRLLADTHMPIQAAKDWAGRGKLLATGESGLILCLLEGTNQLSIEGASTTDVFSWEFVSAGGKFKLENQTPTVEGEHYLGDIFEGECAEFWTALVCRKSYFRKTTDLRKGVVVRPGLAHGEIIRELFEWYTSRKESTSPFTPSELEFRGGGWCNGSSGLAVGYCIAAKIAGESDLSKELSKHYFAELLSWVEQNFITAEAGLCHGVSGVLTVLAGLARELGAKKKLSKVEELYRELLSQFGHLRYPDDLVLDASWLTGSAGIIWGYKAVKQIPNFNPLFPIDSRVWKS